MEYKLTTGVKEMNNKFFVCSNFIKISKYTFIVFFLFLYSAANTVAQVLHVRGNISTQLIPVSNASITFINEADTLRKYSALTDSMGNYSIDIITSVKKDEITIPKSFELEQNYPNPFSNSTAILYKLNEQTNVNLIIYDILGREVRRFNFGEKPAGVYGIIWDGRDNFNRKVTAGIYFYQIRNGKENITKKMLYGTYGSNIQLQVQDFNLSFRDNLRKVNNLNTNDLDLTVKIKNNDATEPQIQDSVVTGISIAGDTVLNFIVEEIKIGKTFKVQGNVATLFYPVEHADITFINTEDTTQKFSTITDSLGNYQLSIITFTDQFTFKADIKNTDSTEPQILTYVLQNIIIRNDTIINFQVLEAKWKLLGLENETVTAIAVDPIEPNIIYAGTLYDFSAGKNGKLFKSTDSGTTWDTLLIGGGYREIIINPSHHNIIYAAWGGIIKSEDGGKTWNPCMDGIYIDFERSVQSLAMNPKNHDVLYAGTGGFYGGTMYKSYDGGLHWNEIGNDSLSDGLVNIAIDPIDTNNIYAATAWRGILWKSTDAGSNWFRTGSGETKSRDIFIDPKTSILYMGISRLGIFKTEDGGLSWEEFNQGLPANCSVLKIKGNNHKLFIIGASEEESGVYEFSILKDIWIKKGTDALPVSTYSDLEISSNPDKLYFGGYSGIYVMDLK